MLRRALSNLDLKIRHHAANACLQSINEGFSRPAHIVVAAPAWSSLPAADRLLSHQARTRFGVLSGGPMQEENSPLRDLPTFLISSPRLSPLPTGRPASPRSPGHMAFTRFTSIGAPARTLPLPVSTLSRGFSSVISGRDWSVGGGSFRATGLLRRGGGGGDLGDVRCREQTRGLKHKVKFKGCKLKVSSSFREKFRTTGDGVIVYQKPGHRHRSFHKTPKQRRQQRTSTLHSTYANTMKRLGFKARKYA